MNLAPTLMAPTRSQKTKKFLKMKDLNLLNKEYKKN
jgi:hypothetical protein